MDKHHLTQDNAENEPESEFETELDAQFEDDLDDGLDLDEEEAEALAAGLVAGQASAETADLAHSGYVAVVGKPNVGKSTLMNYILGEKIAIVSPKPQTTRLRQLGIYNEADTQAIFVDTPGIHQPRHQLGEFMVKVARQAIDDADVILFVVDLTTLPDEADQRVAKLVQDTRRDGHPPVVLALNKLDLVAAEHVLPHTAAYMALVPDAAWTALSAAHGDGVETLLAQVLERLPAGPQYYPDDQLSDMPVREMVAESVREKALLNLADEVPHAVAVEVEEFTERNPELTYIRVTVYVERDSQKGILIGKGGERLKRINASARQDIEQLLGTRVYLEVWVKVLKNWRKDEAMLQRLGYRLRK